MRGELSVGCWVRLHEEDDCYRVEEELYDSADFPIYKLSDGRIVQVWEISDWSKDYTPTDIIRHKEYGELLPDGDMDELIRRKEYGLDLLSDYPDPTPQMLADLRTDDNGRKGR